jgi:hypothetical protein
MDQWLMKLSLAHSLKLSWGGLSKTLLNHQF